MVRHIARNTLVTLLVATIIQVTAAGAATRPGVPQKAAQPQLTYTPLGETVFDCGTYKGNESGIRGMQALHQANNRQIKQGIKRVSPTVQDYVYDNVWVIEDDGSLTISGTNLFDSGSVTHKYTNNGGGVYNVAVDAFTYDATLGSLVATGDDGAVQVTLPFAFPYAGTTYTQMYVSGNGAVSFGAPINPNQFFDSNDFVSSTPKIAAYYMDLDESAATGGGDIRVRSEATKYTVSWISVREYGSFATNTFQLVLFPSGNFTITYNGIGSNVDSIIGFHPGGSNTPLEEISYTPGLPHTSAAGAAVFEQYYSYPDPLVDEVALFQKFYTHFPDDFFQLVYFSNFTQTMNGAFAYEKNLKNDVTGIGLSVFDGSAQYGSNGVLESLCNMSIIDQWASPDPAARIFGKGNNFLTIMGQESGHRWGAFVTYGPSHSNLILGRSDAHWSYYADLDHSSLEGGDWVSTGGSNYTCPTTIDYFSEIDEYLFGMRTPNEVKDFFFISSASNNTSNARSVGTPLMGSVATGTFIPVTVEDIITSEGPRTPVVADEEHVLRQGFIFLIKQGTTPLQAQLDKIALFRKTWEEYFEKSVDGRAALNTVLAGPYAAGEINGEVRDKYSQHIIPNFTARSIERGFVQHVTDDGRFYFLYDDGPTRGTNENVTLIFSAPGYVPDTLSTNIAYGATETHLGLTTGIWLKPVATGVGDSPVLTELHANHPNPFNPETTIEYSLALAGPVRIRVFDTAGHLVRTLVDGVEAKGTHRVMFDGRDNRGQQLASGVYLYRLDTALTTLSRKMVLLK
jgi:hypothetical protein